MPIDITTPCLGAAWPYDVLIEGTSRALKRQHALQLATDMCETCPLTRRCLIEENGDEPWSKSVRRVLANRRRK